MAPSSTPRAGNLHESPRSSIDRQQAWTADLAGLARVE
jgi:hypothetical protein